MMRKHIACLFFTLGAAFSAGATAATLGGSPDPAQVCDGSGMALITISWNAADVNPGRVEVRVGSATGTLFAAGFNVGSAVTGKWVTNNMAFFLIHATSRQVL